jgi:hypothetical protein
LLRLRGIVLTRTRIDHHEQRRLWRLTALGDRRNGGIGKFGSHPAQLIGAVHEKLSDRTPSEAVRSPTP